VTPRSVVAAILVVGSVFLILSQRREPAS
jgi:hypothetical protein